MTPNPYQPLRAAHTGHVPVREVQLHLHTWGQPETASPERPLLVLLHGWMDVGASFQFLVDALHAAGDGPRAIVAPDWRGFGRTRAPETDAYWFPDYLGDLDALLDRLSPEAPVDLLGHSMGGNVAMSYAGVRPTRVHRLVNVEGFGLPATTPGQAPARLAQWLDQLKAPETLRPYADAGEVAARLCRSNPRLDAAHAAWLATQWAEPGADGVWRLRADPAHKHANPMLYRVEEILATWRRITAPLLWVEGADTDVHKWWGHRYPREEFEARLAVVPQVQRHVLNDCGHMVHQDQPDALARLLVGFLAPS